MSTHAHHPGQSPATGYVVRRPLPTDALGKSLRHVFANTTMPDDFASLLHRLDRVTH